MEEQVLTYNPTGDPNPHQTLTLAIRGLRVGQRVEMPDGTAIRSVIVRSGQGNQRRFMVVPKGATAIERHRQRTLNKGVHPSASAAAMAVLGKPTGGQ